VWTTMVAVAMGKMRNCRMRKVEVESKMRNNADWSRRQTT